MINCRMKSVMTMLMLIIFSISVNAQEWSIKNFSVAANDISASQYERKDNKGVSCALVKILMVSDIKEVKGNVVGEIINKGSEKWVYVQKGSKSLQLTVAEGNILSIDFNRYGIPEVKSKSTYLLEIEEPMVVQLRKEVETVTVNGVSFKMIRVDGGTFTMGNNKLKYRDKKAKIFHPEHQVTLSTFYICETEITNELWCSIIQRAEKYVDNQRPQTNMSWMECCSFADRLSNLTGLDFRLPTEAEWEYAARGGKKSKGYKYAGSNNPEEVGLVGYHYVVRVKSYKPNELGIYDMTGNASEWCLDGYDYYPSEPQVDPIVTEGRFDGRPDGGKDKIVRDGDSVASRSYTEEKSINDCRGFRLVVPIQED